MSWPAGGFVSSGRRYLIGESCHDAADMLPYATRCKVMQQAHEMGMSAQDELRFEVIQTLVKRGWTEADAIAAVKEIAPQEEMSRLSLTDEK
jgi:hypothetical protein